MPRPAGDPRDRSSDDDIGQVGGEESTVIPLKRGVISAVQRFFAAAPESADLRDASTPIPKAVVAGAGLPRPWGRYELRRRLGSGSFGEVFSAWDPELQWNIAIKILHEERDLLPEGRALAQFKDCAHIVKVLSIERHEGRVGLCMELIDGEPLDQLVRDFGSFSAAEATGIATAVAQAAGAIHHKHFIHRDIKAQNVMRERAGRIVLMDFGAGRWVDGLSREDSIGTALYMAPELFEGALPSYATDIYSIGVLMFFIVTQKYPVQAQTIDGLKMAHRAGRRRLLGDERPDLPQQFIRIVDRAIAADPDARYQSVAPLLRDLAELDPRNVRRTPLERVAAWAAWTGGAVLALTLLGFINSINFNYMFEREYLTENPGDWLIWGFRSLVLPIASLTRVVIALAAIVGIARFVRLLRPGVDRRLRALGAAVFAVRRRLGLDRPCNFAQFVFLVSLLFIGFIVLLYRPLIFAPFGTISELTPEQRTLLGKSNQLAKLNYETMLAYPLVGLSWGLYRFVRLRRLHPEDGGLPYAAGMGALLLLCAVMLEAPYRIFFQSDDFARVRYAGHECFDLGADTKGNRVVYCPEAVASQAIHVGVDDPLLVKPDGRTQPIEFGNPFRS